MIIQGPHATARSLSQDLLGHLKQLALSAGRTVEVCTCNGMREFVARIRTAKPQSTEFMLLAPGKLAEQAHAHPESGLSDALDALDMPYIEVQDDCDAALEQAHQAPLATVVINGDTVASYRIALGIALRRLNAAL
ncbi:type II 3-dehydroquinate dehydratase [Dyella mobilis]|nr:type II 3-dehydroquinate dehydratase [Dyella mobilis]